MYYSYSHGKKHKSPPGSGLYMAKQQACKPGSVLLQRRSFYHLSGIAIAGNL